MYVAGASCYNCGMNTRNENIVKITRIAAALSAAALAGSAFAVNPIVTHKYSADPNAFVWKDRLYVVCSHDLDGQKGFEMNDYVLMSTDDLVNWTDHGDVFTGGKDVKWCWNLYAPGAAVKDGKVYLYYPNSGGPIGRRTHRSSRRGPSGGSLHRPARQAPHRTRDARLRLVLGVRSRRVC